MPGALQVITRGRDSSGRPIKATRQNFQFTDRLNEGPAKGLLVIVQGGWSFADASGGTHAFGMCKDYRTWNLTSAVRNAVVIQGRLWMGTMWYRTEQDGFDPHIHNNLIGDRPAAASALSQVAQYKMGLNGLFNRNRDRDPFRPDRITSYKYVEDDMFSDEDRARLVRIEKALEEDKTRDQKRHEREKLRFRKLVTQQGALADQITVIMNRTSDTATKTQLKRVQEKILLDLKNDPDITEEDNPSDEGLAERNMG